MEPRAELPGPVAEALVQDHRDIRQRPPSSLDSGEPKTPWFVIILRPFDCIPIAAAVRERSLGYPISVRHWGALETRDNMR